MPALLNLFSRGVPALALLTVPVIFAGLFHYSDVLPQYWALTIFADLLGWIAAVALLAALLRKTLPRDAAPVLTGLVVMQLVLAVGILPSLTTLLFFASSAALGLLLLEFIFRSTWKIPLLPALCVGLALLLSLFGVLIHFPVNYRLPYLALQAVPFGLVLLTGNAEHFGSRMRDELQTLMSVLRQMPYWSWTVMLIGLGYVARHAFYPTITYDDNALHLRLWTELTFQHAAAFDVRSLVWVVAPFTVDLLHAVISLGAAEDARGALNLLLLVVLLQQTWLLTRHFLDSTVHRVLLLALFASTPMLGNLLITLQTELMLAVLTTIAVNVILDMPSRWFSAHTMALLAIAALCCSIKLPGAVLGLLLLGSACLKLLGDKGDAKFQDVNMRSAAMLVIYLIILAALAFNAYVTAWRITGNPVFPLYNAIFHSPFYDQGNFEDRRWLTGFSLLSYWDMFFNTSKHYESQNFVTGFQYALLLPLALLALWVLPARRRYVLVLIPLLGFGVVMFASLQYWRYLFPVVPLASVVLAALLADASSNAARPLWQRAAPVFALVSCLLLNLGFYPGISWVFAIPPQQAMNDARRDRIDELYAPVRTATARINTLLPNSTVLYPDEAAFGATLKGEPYYMMPWYARERGAKARAVQTEDDVGDFLTEEQIDLVVWDTSTLFAPESPKWKLGSYLSRRGFPEFQIGSVIVYRVGATDIAYSPRFTLASSQRATGEPVLLTGDMGVTVDGARNARYSATFDCGSTTGSFVAQVNWDNGDVYYRLVPCADGPVNFAEAVTVPLGVTKAYIYITVLGAPQATVSALTLETN